MIQLMFTTIIFILALLGCGVEVEALRNVDMIGLRGSDSLDERMIRAFRRKPGFDYNIYPKREGQRCSAGGRRRYACPDKMYCRLDDDSCDLDAEGQCEMISAQCTRIYRPVRGCNGRTYSNACVARFQQALKGDVAGIVGRVSGRGG